MGGDDKGVYMSGDDTINNQTLTEDATVPARPEMPPAQSQADDMPMLLRLFYDGDINIDAEYMRRFPAMPMLSVVRLRDLDRRHTVASLSKQDGAASLLVDMDRLTGAARLTFTYGSMLGQRFDLNGLSSLDRQHWLETLRGDLGEPAFLWNADRWLRDYVVGCQHEYSFNLYAFSPLGAVAAVRITPVAMGTLLDWLDENWRTRPQTLW